MELSLETVPGFHTELPLPGIRLQASSQLLRVALGTQALRAPPRATQGVENFPSWRRGQGLKARHLQDGISTPGGPLGPKPFLPGVEISST